MMERSRLKTVVDFVNIPKHMQKFQSYFLGSFITLLYHICTGTVTAAATEVEAGSAVGVAGAEAGPGPGLGPAPGTGGGDLLASKLL